LYKNVLITGYTGFVGQNLYQYLGSGIKSTLVSRNVSSESSSIRSGDKVTDYAALRDSQDGFQAYIHLAGKAHDLKNTADDQAYFDANYGLTKEIYDRFLDDEQAEVFVFVSSVKAASDQPDEVLTEAHSPDPVTAYGKSKLKAEEYIQANLPEGKSVVILRPCMIHGPGNKGNLNLLYSIVSRGIPWPLGAFDNNRSFLSIDNFCSVIEEILEGKFTSGVYNIADNKPLSTRDLVELIANVSDRKPRIWNTPKPLINLIAKAGNVLPLPLNEERLQKLTENYVVSNEKLVNELGKPLPVSAEDGLIKTLQSFRSGQT